MSIIHNLKFIRPPATIATLKGTQKIGNLKRTMTLTFELFEPTSHK